MSKQLVILGASRNAYDILDIVDALNAQRPTWDVIGFLDDNQLAGDTFAGIPILGPLDHASQLPSCKFINAIGSDSSYRQRPALIGRIGQPLERYCTLVHPYANVSRGAKIGIGTYVAFAANIGGNAFVGNHVVIGPSCAVGHDSHTGDHSILARNAAVNGSVHIEDSVYLGAACVVRPGLRIGRQALVGMGAVVIRDVAPGTVVVGNPARPLR